MGTARAVLRDDVLVAARLGRVARPVPASEYAWFMAAKQTTYWLCRLAADPTAPPEWQQLDARPTTSEGLYGEWRVENDDQIALLYFEDDMAYERVTRRTRDVAALVQEHAIPHRPVRPDE